LLGKEGEFLGALAQQKFDIGFSIFTPLDGSIPPDILPEVREVGRITHN